MRPLEVTPLAPLALVQEGLDVRGLQPLGLPVEGLAEEPVATPLELGDEDGLTRCMLGQPQPAPAAQRGLGDPPPSPQPVVAPQKRAGLFEFRARCRAQHRRQANAAGG